MFTLFSAHSVFWFAWIDSIRSLRYVTVKSRFVLFLFLQFVLTPQVRYTLAAYFCDAVDFCLVLCRVGIMCLRSPQPLHVRIDHIYLFTYLPCMHATCGDYRYSVWCLPVWKLNGKYTFSAVGVSWCWNGSTTAATSASPSRCWDWACSISWWEHWEHWEQTVGHSPSEADTAPSGCSRNLPTRAELRRYPAGVTDDRLQTSHGSMTMFSLTPTAIPTFPLCRSERMATRAWNRPVSADWRSPVCVSVTEGEQLPAVPAGPGAAHRPPAVPVSGLHARQPADAHRPQAGEHPVRQLRLRRHLQSQKGGGRAGGLSAQWTAPTVGCSGWTWQPTVGCSGWTWQPTCLRS